MKTAWLSCEVLSWDLHPQAYHEFDDTDVNRAYEHLAHAERLLALVGVDDMYLVDVVTTLKRCLNQRLMVLNQLYDFSSAPIHGQPKRLLDQLAAFNLVRPLLLQHLIEIRNVVEHKDARPPSRQRCGELLDVMWYFLRSTDFLVRRRTSMFVLECPNTASGEKSPFIEVTNLENRPWHFGFSGIIPQGILSPEEVHEWLQMELLDWQPYLQLVNVPPSLDLKSDIELAEAAKILLKRLIEKDGAQQEIPGGYELKARLIGPPSVREAISRLWIRTL